MVVVDTSIVFKWLQEEDNRHLSLKILEDFLDGNQEILAPDILLYELANILSFKKELEIVEAIEAWNLFVDFKIKIYIPNTDFLAKCLEFAKKYNISVYDASFTVLAQENKCNFITADQKFVEQVNLPFVKCLGNYK